VVDPANVTAGLAEMTDRRLPDLQRTTITRISGIKRTDYTKKEGENHAKRQGERCRFGLKTQIAAIAVFPEIRALNPRNPGVHVVDPANVTAGLAGMTDRRLPDLQRTTITRISGIKRTDYTKKRG